MNHVKNIDAELLLSLQRGIPLEKRPFALTGRGLGLSEQEVLGRAQALLGDGTARRFGAVFDSQSLGYRSTLCAVDVPEKDLVRIAGLVTPHPGVTHCYQRNGKPNLWFTMTAPDDALEQEIRRIEQAVAPHELLNLPALRRFKIEAVFDVRAGCGSPTPPTRAKQAPGLADRVPPLSETERRVVRGLQGNIPLTADPFQALAAELGYAHEELLSLLQRWQQAGILRRVGLIMYHRALGFTTNSMCVWKADPDAVEAAGRSMAERPEVTHCYERPAFALFPFNLYAMIHAGSPDAARAIYEQLTQESGLPDGRMLMSVREFKKSSPVFFDRS